MKNILLIILPLLLIVGCEEGPKKIIVETWEDGTPKKVDYVIGDWLKGIQQETLRSITYYENGEIIKDENFKAGKLDGKFTGWYESGQKRIEGNYIAGEHTGTWTSWDSLGVETSAAEWFEKGYNAGKNKEYNKAITFYLQTVELDPNYDIYKNLGNAYANRGDLSKAIQSYEKAIELTPDAADTYYNLGNVYTNQGDLTNAIQSYEKTIELDPEHAGAYYNLGNVYANQGEDLPKAIQLLQEAARLGLRGDQE